MSHEIRTPINAILGYAELLQMELPGPLSEGQREFVERLQTASRHLLTLVSQVLDLAKIESGTITVAKAHSRLGDALASALPLIEPQASARGIEIVRACDADALDYVGDGHRVTQILVNLLSNAVKFTPPGGRITIECGRSAMHPAAQVAGAGPWLFARVTDTGSGISADQLDSIFRPFVQVHAAETIRAAGTGLGLTISRQLARLMGGDLTVSSQQGAGSSFTLWLCASTGQA